MISEPRKQAIINQLKADPVPITDVVLEVVADAIADMFVLTMEKRDPEELSDDKRRLCELEEEYLRLYTNHPKQAVAIIQMIFEIGKKYDCIRFTAE